MKRVLLPVVLALGAVALVGCGDDDASSATTTTTEAESTTTEAESTTTTSTTAADDGSDEEGAVVDAYERHWSLFYAFLNGERPGDPAELFAGQRVEDVRSTTVRFAEQNLEVRGSPDLEVREVDIDGTRATLVDCQLDGTSGVVRDTGEVVIPPSEGFQRVDVELEKVDGAWKVSEVIYQPEGSCRR